MAQGCQCTWYGACPGRPANMALAHLTPFDVADSALIYSGVIRPGIRCSSDSAAVGREVKSTHLGLTPYGQSPTSPA